MNRTPLLSDNCLLNSKFSWAVLVHACIPSPWGGRGRQISEFEASLVYRVSSRTAGGYTEKPCLKKTKSKKQKQTKQNKTKKNSKFILWVQTAFL